MFTRAPLRSVDAVQLLCMICDEAARSKFFSVPLQASVIRDTHFPFGFELSFNSANHRQLTRSAPASGELNSQRDWHRGDESAEQRVR
jgi:hypothetical protein